MRCFDSPSSETHSESSGAPSLRVSRSFVSSRLAERLVEQAYASVVPSMGRTVVRHGVRRQGEEARCLLK